MIDPVDAVRDVLGMPRETPLDYPELVHPEPRADEPPVYDHKAEAERLLTLAGGQPSDDPGNSAIARAVLALVEQQRFANLIALGHGVESREIREGLGL